MTYDIDELLGLAKRVAAAGAAIHRQGFGRPLATRSKSSETDLVSEIDIETEHVLVAGILQERPEDAIVSEEGAHRPGRTGVCWILDPLDGTTNYLYGYPAFGVAVGVEVDGQGVVGVVHDTYHDRVYAGSVDRAATCDGEPITVSASTRLETALIATGFLADREIRRRQGLIVAEMLPRVRDIRRSGSPILDLCGVASGTIDGFYEFGLGRWDIAAGAVIAAAAGAKVAIMPHQGLASPLVVASTPSIHEALLESVFASWKRANI